jgi:hypothetical protein
MDKNSVMPSGMHEAWNANAKMAANLASPSAVDLGGVLRASWSDRMALTR